MQQPLNWVLIAIVIGGGVIAASAEEPSATPASMLETFSKQWDERAWVPKTPRRPTGYMRPLDDSGWQLRMKTLQALVAAGERSAPALTEALASDDPPTRILAAQTLGYLNAREARDRLLEVAKADRDAVARLYAVDSLGMLGTTGDAVDWDALLEGERNGDVRKHIHYAQERKDQPVDKAVVEALRRWDAAQINTARMDEPAPDFTLPTATGETIHLSQYRGKQPVVLVFIYGDT